MSEVGKRVIRTLLVMYVVVGILGVFLWMTHPSEYLSVPTLLVVTITVAIHKVQRAEMLSRDDSSNQGTA